jgi:hypothetical protein
MCIFFEWQHWHLDVRTSTPTVTPMPAPATRIDRPVTPLTRFPPSCALHTCCAAPLHARRPSSCNSLLWQSGSHCNMHNTPIYFWNIQMNTIATYVQNNWNIRTHAPKTHAKNTWKTIANICNIHVKTFATYVWNICKIQHTCNIRLKKNRWNIGNKHLQHTCKIITTYVKSQSTFATST